MKVLVLKNEILTMVHELFHPNTRMVHQLLFFVSFGYYHALLLTSNIACDIDTRFHANHLLREARLPFHLLMNVSLTHSKNDNYSSSDKLFWQVGGMQQRH
jgi:hypothetical protein